MELGLLNAKAATDFLNLYGVAVTLETEKLSGTIDEWGDTPEEFGTGTTAIKVIFQGTNKNDLWTKQGLLEQGDAIVYVQSTTSIKIRDRILKGTVEYEIVAIETCEFQGVTSFYRLACKRLAA